MNGAAENPWVSGVGRRLVRAGQLRLDPMYWAWWFGKLQNRGEHYLRPSGLRYGVLGRNGSTDYSVYRQIFVEEEYQCIKSGTDPEWIVDLGANVGYSSAYFLSRFPKACVLALEPDDANYRMLRRNLSPYGGRVRTFQGAIWSAACRMKASPDTYRGGGAWACQFEADEAGSIVAVDMPWLMQYFGINKISILKMDIEGAEVEVFRAADLAWLDRVETLVVEIHDDSHFGNASELILPQMEKHGFSTRVFGELTIFERIG